MKSYIISCVIYLRFLDLSVEAIDGGVISPNLELRNLNQVNPLIFTSNPDLKFSTKIKESSIRTLPSLSGLKELQFITIKNPAYRLNDVKKKKVLKSDEIQTNTEEIQEMIIWKIENSELYRSDVVNYEEFDSNGAYLTMQTEVNEKPKNWRIHYWIGKNSPLTDAVDIAYCAAHLDFEIRSTMRIHREAEGRESTTFKAFFKQKSNDKRSSSKRTPKKSNLRGKRMFLVKGIDDLYLEEVEVSVNRLADGDCALFSSRKVHVFCKSIASEQHRRAALELAEYILDKRGLDQHGVIFHHQSDEQFWNLPFDERQRFSLFLGELERSSAKKKKSVVDNPFEFEPEEIRKILGQTVTKEDGKELFFRTKITRIQQDDSQKLRAKSESSENVQLTMLNTQDCYVIDSRSNAGLFVWIGQNATLNVRKGCVKTAEQVIRDTKYYGKDGYLPNSIIYIHQDDVPLGINDVQQLIRHHLNPLYTERKQLEDAFLFKAFEPITAK